MQKKVVLFALALSVAAAIIAAPEPAFAEKLQIGSYELQDIKGAVFYKPFFHDGYVISPGLYMLLNLVGTPDAIAKLYIAREGDDIKVSWDGNAPDIYYLASDTVEGKYVSQPDTIQGWTKVLDGKTGAALYKGFAVDVKNKNMKHLNQVGAGLGEVYYKGLMAGITKPESYLYAAEAVGKVNITLQSGGLGYNYISVPFTYNTDQIKDVLDPAYPPIGTRVFSQMEGFNFDIAELNSSRVWVSAFEPAKTTDIGSTFYIYPERSYMIKVPSAKTITVIGRVLTPADGYALQIQGSDHAGGNLYTYFGNYYPRQYSLSDADVSDTLLLSKDVSDGDRIFYPTDLSFNFNIAYYKDKLWRSEFDPNKTQLTDINLKLPVGYMYKRNGASFYWTR